MYDVCVIDSPVGQLKLTSQQNFLKTIELDCQLPLTPPTCSFHQQIIEQLDKYFFWEKCSADSFSFDIPVLPQGTQFQNRVWQALRNIPVGKVISYGELAEKLSSSARAIGNACRNNPVPIIVPCHRVVSKSGLGGFAGATEGTLCNIKRRLLEHEGICFA